jgi:hypothetical protein
MWAVRKKCAGAPVDVAVEAGAATAAQAAGAPDQAPPLPRKKSRAVQPGSFLALMMRAQHEKSGEPFSDVNITSQAFTFLLAGARPLGRQFWRLLPPDSTSLFSSSSNRHPS